MSASAFEAPAQEAAQDAPVSEQPAQPDIPRAETLLRSASLLLGRGSQLDAAHALHVELARELRQAPPPPPASRKQAEDLHRQLTAELTRQRAQQRPPLALALRSRKLL